MEPIYTPDFFARNRINSVRSAEIILPYVFGHIYRPTSICDIGCGVGGFLAVANRLGIWDVLGVDGDYVKPETRLIAEFMTADLAVEMPNIQRVFDLAICLEVAEHLEASRTEPLIGILTKLAPVVLFSAAIPGQGGRNHINEQKPEHWIGLFEANGFIALDCLRRQFWDDQRIAWWYAQNILLFASPNGLKRLRNVEGTLVSSRSPFIHIVHPRHGTTY